MSPPPAKDNFSRQADLYAKYRPVYPGELYDFILQFVKQKEFALDCATGNGQAAAALANYFKKVYAIDTSEKQLEFAVKKKNIEYLLSNAEQTPFADNTFDLITAATALHWLRFDIFYNEVKRIAKENCVFAGWGYDLVQTDINELNKLIVSFYKETISGYWDAERRYVDERYRTIPFPFDEIKNPGFITKFTWQLNDLEGFLNTWSAVQHYIRINKTNPVTRFMNTIKHKLRSDMQFEAIFPIFMRVGIVHKQL